MEKNNLVNEINLTLKIDGESIILRRLEKCMVLDNIKKENEVLYQENGIDIKEGYYKFYEKIEDEYKLRLVCTKIEKIFNQNINNCVKILHCKFINKDNAIEDVNIINYIDDLHNITLTPDVYK